VGLAEPIRQHNPQLRSFQPIVLLACEEGCSFAVNYKNEGGM